MPQINHRARHQENLRFSVSFDQLIEFDRLFFWWKIESLS